MSTKTSFQDTNTLQTPETQHFAMFLLGDFNYEN